MEQTVLVCKEPVGQDCRSEVHVVKDVQVYPVRDISLHEFRKERSYGHSHNCDDKTDDPVECPVQAHQGTNRFGVILCNGFVHAEDHRTADTEFSQIKEGKDGIEKTAEAEILHTEVVQDDATHYQRHCEIEHLKHAVEHNVPRCVFRPFDLHPVMPFPVPSST